MDQIELRATLTIHPGKQAVFLELADKCIRIVEEEDTGTLRYDWFLNEAGDECLVRESYTDSDAVLEHISHVGETLGALLETASMELEIFGEPSAALAEASANFGATVYSLYGGAGRS